MNRRFPFAFQSTAPTGEAADPYRVTLSRLQDVVRLMRQAQDAMADLRRRLDAIEADRRISGESAT